jgi:hypothetical protein
MSSVNLTELNSTLGAYSRDKGQDLYTKFKSRLALNVFTPLEGIADEHPLPRLRVLDLIKKGNVDSFSATANALGFSSRILKVRPVKVDVRIFPQPMWKTFLATQLARPANEVTEIPFEQVIMDAILAQAASELQNQSIFTGAYGTGSDTAATALDGLCTTIDAAIASGEIPSGNVVERANITVSNAIDEIEKVKNIVPSEYLMSDEFTSEDEKLVCLLSKKDYDLYCTDYRASFGSLVYNTEFPKGKIDGTDIAFVPVSSFADNMVTITRKKNLFLGVDALSNITNLNTQVFERSIKVMMDLNIGVNFAEGQEIWTNGEIES